MHMILALFIFSILVIFICKYYLLNHSINQLSDDIKHKKISQSNLLLTHSTNNPAISKLTQEINLIFDTLYESQNSEREERETFNLALHNIAHDIRTPLTIADGYLQQIIKNSPDEDKALVKAKENLSIVSKRLEVLLEYQSLLENRDIEVETLNLSLLLKNILLKYYDRLSARDFNVIFDFPEQDYYIKNNPDTMERIFQNIFGNVLKHGKNNLVLKLENNNNKVTIVVENESQRPIAAVEKLANRFYSENMSSIESSSGLGLYIVKELVEQTKGEFDVFYSSPMFILMVSWEIVDKT